MSDILRKRAIHLDPQDMDKYSPSATPASPTTPSHRDEAPDVSRTLVTSPTEDSFHSANSKTYEVKTEREGRKLMSEEEVSNLVHNALRRARQATSSTSPRHRSRLEVSTLSPDGTLSPVSPKILGGASLSRPPSSPAKHALAFPGDNSNVVDVVPRGRTNLRVGLPPKYHKMDASVASSEDNFTTPAQSFALGIDTTTSNISADEGGYGRDISKSATEESDENPLLASVNSSDAIIRRVEEEIANARKAAQEANRRLAGVSTHLKLSEPVDRVSASREELEKVSYLPHTDSVESNADEKYGSAMNLLAEEFEEMAEAPSIEEQESLVTMDSEMATREAKTVDAPAAMDEVEAKDSTDIMGLESESVDKARYDADAQMYNLTNVHPHSSEEQPIDLVDVDSFPDHSYPNHLTAQGNVFMRRLEQVDQEERIASGEVNSDPEVIDLTTMGMGESNSSKERILESKSSAESSDGAPLEYDAPEQDLEREIAEPESFQEQPSFEVNIDSQGDSFELTADLSGDHEEWRESVNEYDESAGEENTESEADLDAVLNAQLASADEGEIQEGGVETIVHEFNNDELEVVPSGSLEDEDKPSVSESQGEEETREVVLEQEDKTIEAATATAFDSDDSSAPSSEGGDTSQDILPPMITPVDEYPVVNNTDSAAIDDIVLAEVATKEELNEEVPSTESNLNEQLTDEETTSSTPTEVAGNNEKSAKQDSTNQGVIETIVTSLSDMEPFDEQPAVEKDPSDSPSSPQSVYEDTLSSPKSVYEEAAEALSDEEQSPGKAPTTVTKNIQPESSVSYQTETANEISSGSNEITHTEPSPTERVNKVRFKQRYPVPPLTGRVRASEDIIMDNRIAPEGNSVFLKKPKPDLQKLLDAARGSSIARRSNACGALKVLTVQKKNKLTLVRTAGFLDALVFAASAKYSSRDIESSIEARTRAVSAISNVCEPKENRELIFAHPGLPVALVKTAVEEKGEARAAACAAIALLAKTPSNREPLAHVHNLINVLAMILVGGNSRDEFADDDSQSYSADDEDSENDSFSSDSESSSSSIENDSSYDEEVTLPAVMSMRQAKREKTEETMKRAQLNACASVVHLSKQCGATPLMCYNEKLMDALLEVSCKSHDPMHTKCIEVICNLTRFPENNDYMARYPGLVDTLVRLGSSSLSTNRVWALRTLQNLSSGVTGKTVLANRVVLELLSISVMRDALDEQTAATATLYNLSTEPGAVVPLTNTKNVVATLVHVAHNPESPSQVRLMACDALATLGLWLQTLAGAGTIPPEINEEVALPSYITSGWKRWD